MIGTKLMVLGLQNLNCTTIYYKILIKTRGYDDFFLLPFLSLIFSHVKAMAPQAKQIAATICTISTYQSVHPWSSILTNSISNRASAFSINRQNYYVYLNTSISIKNIDIKFSANDTFLE